MLFEYLRKFLSRHKVCRHVLRRTAVVHIYPLTAHSVRHCKYPAGGKGIRKPGYKPLGIREMRKRINKPIGPYFRQRNLTLRELEARHLQMFLWGDRIFEKCGIGRDEGGDGGKTLEIRGKRRLSARDGGANYQQS